jgi:hypothetical protein
MARNMERKALMITNPMEGESPYEQSPTLKAINHLADRLRRLEASLAPVLKPDPTMGDVLIKTTKDEARRETENKKAALRTPVELALKELQDLLEAFERRVQV